MKVDRLLARFPLSRTTLVVGLDALIVTASLPLAFMLRDERFVALAALGEIAAMVPVLLLAAVLGAFVVGTHRPLWRAHTPGDLLRLSTYVALVVVVFFTTHRWLDGVEGIPRSVPIIHFFVAFFGLVAARLTYASLRRLDRAHDGPYAPAERLLLVGADERTPSLVQMLAAGGAGRCDVVGILCDEIARDRQIGGVPFLGGLADFTRVLAALQVQGLTPTRLVVTRPHHDLGREAIYDVMQHAVDAGIRVDQLPDLIGREDMPAPASIDAGRAGAEPAFARLKRAADIAVAGTALVLSCWLLALIAAAVALGVQRPVVFVQVRPGRGRHPFRLYKFRTMRDPIAPDGRRLSDEARTPPVGRLLRRLRLDELPQFWNVLRGDMALIGPRPLVAADLDAMADGGRTRCTVRPGITGWAQVNGGHQLTADEKLALDRWYAEHASLRLDLEIIVRTLGMMVWGERRCQAALARAQVGRQPTMLLGAAD